MADAPLYARTFECPACGAQVPQARPGSRTLVCGYCGQTSHLNADTLEAVGSQHLLLDYGSIFGTGQQGRLAERAFLVLGRLRFDYEDGFWDEWYLQFLDDGSEAWVQEDDGSFVLFRQEATLDRPISYGHVLVGRHFDFISPWEQVFITSKSRAQINGGEGELPFRIVPGEQADFIDGIWQGRVLSLELLPGEQALFIGAPLDLDQVQLDALPYSA